MTSLLITLDDPTRRRLDSLSRLEGIAAEDAAARLLRRAVMGARPRRTFDTDAILRINEPFAHEDLALAESDSESRLELLLAEDSL